MYHLVLLPSAPLKTFALCVIQVPPGTLGSALDLFEHFLTIAKWCTYTYAESKKSKKKSQYKTFMKKKVGKSHLFAFIGALILLGIHTLRKAWSTGFVLPLLT